MTKVHIFVKQLLAASFISAVFAPLCFALPIEDPPSPFSAQPLNLGSAPFISPNVMLFMDTSGSMTDPPPQGVEQKINSAANAVNNLFMHNPNVRWGLFTFDNRGLPNPIGPFNEYTYNNAGILRVPIADYDAQHVKLLTEQVEEMRTSVLSGNGTNTPLTEAYIEMAYYFAGKESPYGDPIPNGATRYTSPIQYRCQKNFIIDVTDGLANADTHFPRPDEVLGSDDETLDAAAKGAYDADFMQSGNDLEGFPFSSSKQNVLTYTVGFTTNQDTLQDAAKNGHGKYYNANNKEELTNALQKAIHDMIGEDSSSSAPGSSDVSIFSLGYKTQTWSGSLLIYKNVAGMPTGSPVPAESKATDRLVFTNYGSGSSRSFMKVSPDDTRMNTDTKIFGSNPTSTLNFLVGNEPTTTTQNPWRARNGDLLGDFIDTNLAVIDDAKFLAAGANDGLLHIFAKGSPYKEVLAYAPSATLSKVQYVAQTNYGQESAKHRYLVDGPISIQDINMNASSPHTILVGALGRGGKGYYALDMSKVSTGAPGSQNINQIGLWDKNEEDQGIWGSSLGYTLGKPVIAQVNYQGAKKWVTIVGNGFGSGKKGTVYFLDLITGNKLGEIGVGSDGAKSGFGNLTVIDKDNDNVADIIYAGDMNGDVWRIGLGNGLSNFSTSKIWSGSISQPITAPIEAAKIGDSKYVVIFGTGSLLYDGDKEDKHQQTLYGIYDDISTAGVTLSYSADRGIKGKLLKQSILDTQTVGSNTYRKVSSNPMPTDGTKTGWYIDLPIGSLSAERITAQMLILTNKLVFSTQIPSTQKGTMCSGSSGDGWEMALNLVSGSGLLSPLFGGEYESSVNFNTGSAVPSGFKSKNGMLSGLSFSAPKEDIQTYKSLSGEINNSDNYARGIVVEGLNIAVSGDKKGSESHSTSVVKGKKINVGIDCTKTVSAKNGTVNYEGFCTNSAAGDGSRISWRDMSQE